MTIIPFSLIFSSFSNFRKCNNKKTSFYSLISSQKSDSFLNVLPLHHTHGLFNALIAPLSVGASVTFLRPDPHLIWKYLLSSDQGESQNPPSHPPPRPITVFTSVPTVYYRLLGEIPSLSPRERERVPSLGKRLRLMMSGSAACPEVGRRGESGKKERREGKID